MVNADDKNIKLNFLHICDYASFGERGKLNILGIFKNINILKIPTVYPQLFIVTSIIVANSGSFKEVIKIVDDENIDILNPPLQFNLNSPPTRKEKQAKIGVVAQVNNLRLSKKGKYKVQIYVNNKLIGETTLMVSKLK